MFFMSASFNCEAKARMIGLARRPLLNSCNCLTRYSGCCCANLGLAGTPELPSAPWHAAHTAANLAEPWVRSGLASAGAAAGAACAGTDAAEAAGSACCWAIETNAGTANRAAVSREAIGFIGGVVFLGAKAHDSTMPHLGFSPESKAPA